MKEFLQTATNQKLVHKKKFEKIYEDFKNTIDLNDDYLFDSEVSAYFKGMIENQVFNKNDNNKEAFADLKTAVKYAVDAEELTVAF